MTLNDFGSVSNLTLLPDSTNFAFENFTNFVYKILSDSTKHFLYSYYYRHRYYALFVFSI